MMSDTDTTAQPTNLLLLMSDEHNRRMLGCYGHPLVRTPHLDALAARGVRLTNAYCNSPLCVPSRASFATGRYVHEIGAWDNARPYEGTPPSWGAYLAEAGRHVTTIGKLDFRGDGVPDGFADQRLAKQRGEKGDLLGLFRDRVQKRPASRQRAMDAGIGESRLIQQDRAVTAAAADWLSQEAGQATQPWTLYVSWITPHFPLIVPEEYFNLYPLDQIDLPDNSAEYLATLHPVVQQLRWHFDVDEPVPAEQQRVCRAAYYGLCTFLDEQVGQVLAALEQSGQAANTRIIYVSDHGEMLGEHGLWWKCAPYEGDIGIPAIAAGPGVPEGRVVNTPVSLLDLAPTILDNAGVPLPDDLRGDSLWPILTAPDQPDRQVFCEYHGHGTPGAYYVLRLGDLKYVYYIGYRPQLFNLAADPGERRDLAPDPAYAATLADFEARLRAIVDPAEADQRAKVDQARRLARLTANGEALPEMERWAG
ncbi:MAG: sulfatase-like hydrolase/transferase [Thermomicrobiales bacterium]